MRKVYFYTERVGLTIAERAIYRAFLHACPSAGQGVLEIHVVVGPAEYDMGIVKPHIYPVESGKAVIALDSIKDCAGSVQFYEFDLSTREAKRLTFPTVPRIIS